MSRAAFPAAGPAAWRPAHGFLGVLATRANIIPAPGILASGWTLTNLGIVDAAGPGPYGPAAASAIPTTGSGAHSMTRSLVATVAQPWRLRVFARRLVGTYNLQLRIGNAASAGTNNVLGKVLLSDGTTSAAASAGNGSGAALASWALGDGWFLCELTGQPDTSGTSVQPGIFVTNASETQNYAGDGTSGLLLYLPSLAPA